MIINYTSVTVKIYGVNGRGVSIPPCGVIIEREVTYTPLIVRGGIEFNRAWYGRVKNVPPAENGVFVLVTPEVYEILSRYRGDVVTFGYEMFTQDGFFKGYKGVVTP